MPHPLTVSCLPDLAMIAAPTLRARAYLQAMIGIGVAPSRILRLPGDTVLPPEHGQPVTVDYPAGRWNFRPAEFLERTMAGHGITEQTMVGNDVNDPAFVDCLRAIPEPVILYCGPGGQILKQEALTCGKRFLHIHGGFVPDYRGSTAFYYSLLRDGVIGASALWLDQGIDTGRILARDCYAPLPGQSVDYISDPCARADLLLRVIGQRVAEGQWPEGEPIDQPGETYFVIHPLLKHLALRRVGLQPAAPPTPPAKGTTKGDDVP